MIVVHIPLFVHTPLFVVYRLLKEECKVSALVQSLKNPSFNPKRAAIVVPKSGWKGLKPNGGGKGTSNTTYSCYAMLASLHLQ